jgi:hypothetical protein
MHSGCQDRKDERISFYRVSQRVIAPSSFSIRRLTPLVLRVSRSPKFASAVVLSTGGRVQPRQMYVLSLERFDEIQGRFSALVLRSSAYLSSAAPVILKFYIVDIFGY